MDDPRLEQDSEDGRLKAVLKTAQLLECEVITAPRAEMRKQLAGFPKLWLDLKLNLHGHLDLLRVPKPLQRLQRFQVLPHTRHQAVRALLPRSLGGA